MEKLDREDWQGHAGFAKLTWEDFLAKHKTFISDVKSGKWDSITGEILSSLFQMTSFLSDHQLYCSLSHFRPVF